MCIDLKSFYASVECVERGLDPITTNLVVADESRTDKTICLAVSPALKDYGIGGRARLFEVKSKVRYINNNRRKKINYHKFIASSYKKDELNNNPLLELDFIAASPRMKLYMKYSALIYNIYLKYLSSEDIYVYSIDEVFCDITNYLKYYKLTPRAFVTKIIKDVYATTGIIATAGIGTNLYLAKVAMDILAKHVKPNKEGVRIACLDEMRYRKFLWNHKPLTDFWRVGCGISKKLEVCGIKTMGDIARFSLEKEDVLYKLFGVNAELLIDHAWGWEPCTIKDIKRYVPVSNSLSSGQVLHCPYEYNKARLIVKEMIDLLVLDMVSKECISDTFVLDIGYDIDNLINSDIKSKYYGEIVKDHYGRFVPKSSHGTAKLRKKTSSTRMILKEVLKLFDTIVNKNLLIRRINITASNLVNEKDAKSEKIYEQFDIFSNAEKVDEEIMQDITDEKVEKKIQHIIIDLKNKYGKNAILKGMNLEEGATTIQRNQQVGGHKG